MHAETTDTQGARAGRREWIGFAVLMLPLLLVSMDVSVLYFAVPFITQELELSGTQQLWVFDIYGFVLAGLLIAMGALGDRIGRRRLLLIGATAFGAASLLAAYAGDASTLIAARALLGIGGATLMPSTLALVRNMFHDARQRGTAIAIWSAVMTGGIAIGPVLSGLLLERFWWGSVFLVNIPAMVLLLVLAPMLVPEFRNPRAGRFDLLSAVLSLATILPVIYGIKELANHGFEPVPAGSILVGLAVGVLFVRRQRRPGALIDLELFRRRAFSGAIAMNLLGMFATVGFAIFSTQYLQSVLGMSPLRAALWSLLPTVVVGGMAPLAAALARRFDRAFIMSAGFLLAACGFWSLTRVEPDSSLWGIMIGASVYAGGLIIVMSLVTDMVMGLAPPERAGSASGLLESGTELGGALGMALLGSLGDAVYRRQVTDAVEDMPAGLPPEAAEAARETLGGAIAVSEQLPGALGDAVTHAAREAFTSGMHAAAIGAAALMVVAAVLSTALLRGARPGTPDPEGRKTPSDAPAPTTAPAR
ncbi:MFS transporter [Allostreptomyces psammosilenae]|uniref:DHA2 family multidrug resistance protein-like MFS transporter n=1 Tax=Allostreptomyces psammosilenae TaxID=1892865 RepID=A0A853A4N5_9ACTN|nr:MFS transporter [Allostreptomyces psammosilenae]NYI05462.1 DHA2 family multidrug resistance protein-like MFS transporter [Allostreptomyces psammosilenae]